MTDSNDKRTLADKTVGGGIATILGQGSSTVINLLALMALARLIAPQDFGLMAKVVAVTSIVSLLGDLGLSLATIQSKSINQQQLSAFFWINLVFASAMACVLLAVSPALVAFYNDVRVGTVVRVMALTTFVNGIGIQHRAYMTRNMRFANIALIAICSQTLAATIAVVAAWFGWEYRALLIQLFMQTAFRTLFLCLASGFKPGLYFRGTGIREQLKMGGSFTASNIVNHIARNADNVIIAKIWGETAVAHYAKSYSLLLLPLQKLAGPMQTVAVPALSKLQDNALKFRAFFRRGFQVALYLQVPITIFTAFAGEDIILCFLGRNWTDAIPIFYALIPNLIATTTSPATSWVVLATGDTARYFKCVLINGFFLISSFLLVAPYGVLAVAWTFSLVTCITRVPIILYAIRPSPIEAKDIFPLMVQPVVYSSLSAIPLVCFFFGTGGLGHWILLPVKGLIFFTTYYFLTLQSPAAKIVRREIKQRLHRFTFSSDL
jgi:PST family polysaccharide transporter